jgi:hypothetical protein
MSQHLDSLRIGDTIDAKGPLGHVHYQGQGRYTLDGEAHRASRINMIAGGTGITPMYQVRARSGALAELDWAAPCPQKLEALEGICLSVAVQRPGCLPHVMG